MLLWHTWSLITYLYIINNSFSCIPGLSFEREVATSFKDDSTAWLPEVPVILTCSLSAFAIALSVL